MSRNKIYADIDALSDCGGKIEDIFVMLCQKWKLSASLAMRIITKYLQEEKRKIRG